VPPRLTGSDGEHSGI